MVDITTKSLKMRVPGYGAYNSRLSASEEKWIPTVCNMCYNACSIQVLVRDGVATAVEGLPGAPPNYGKMCAKGKSALIGLYSPTRVTQPLRRTNPEKGLDVDPGWEKITWEEALSTIADKIRRVRESNRGSISVMTFDSAPAATILGAFQTACGGGDYGGAVPSGVNLFCGRAVHPVALMLNGSSDKQPDFTHCKYLLVFGGGFGTGTGTHAMSFARHLAESRVKQGLKLVVVDPCRTSAGARADEWIPIVPGTDAALCLAMANVLVNELGIYDKEFLLRYTNAPYLIGPDGHYFRDLATGKPLILSGTQRRPLPYDSSDWNDTVLEGETEVDGVRTCTAFALLRQHLRSYTPEYASEITTIPVATVRRMASEFGTSAQIGATAVIDGVTLPLRPACAVWYRGLGQHQHGLQRGWAAAMLNILTGAVDVPGGYCGTETTGPWGLPIAGQDGLLTVTNPYAVIKRSSIPVKQAEFDPHDASLVGMFPVSIVSSVMSGLTLRMPEKFKMESRPEVWICVRSNPMKSAGDPEETAEILRKIPFQVSLVQHHEETSQFADIVLPDAHYLERFAPFSRDSYSRFMHSPGPQDTEWDFATQQPAVKSMGESRNWIEVIWDLAHRGGFADELYKVLNISLKLPPEHELKPGQTYSFQEFSDRWMQSWCGEEHDLAYFKKHGWASSPSERTVRHRYPRIFHQGRIPLYLEHWLTAGESVRKVIEKEGIDWGDISDYEPMVNFRPCLASQEGGADFPLFLVSPKVGFLTLSTSTIKNPHLQELAWASGEIFNVGVHPSVAKTSGIQGGDRVEIKSANGKKVIATARVTRDVHESVVVAPGNVSKVLSPDEKYAGEGVHSNSFLPYELDRIDVLSGALDACVKVRIRKVGMQ